MQIRNLIECKCIFIYDQTNSDPNQFEINGWLSYFDCRRDKTEQYTKKH